MQVDQIFAPLREELSKRGYTTADLFEMIGCWVEDAPHISRAMALHSRDILATSHSTDATAILIEVYRRTFFDRTCAVLYGTAQLCEEGPAALDGLVAYVIASLRMDDAARNDGSNILQ